MEKNYMCNQISNCEILMHTYRWKEHEKGYTIDCMVSDFDILYTCDGEYEITINDVTYTSHSGDLLLIPPGSKLTLTAKTHAAQCFCHFSMASAEHVALGARFVCYRCNAQANALVQMYADAMRVCEQPEAQMPHSVRLIIKLLLLAMVEQHPENNLRLLGERVSHLPKEVSNALQYIHTHVSQPITTEMLAKQSGFNTAYFSRYFKKYVGVSPLQYNMNYKLDFARHLVTTSERGLKEIAEMTGFADQFTFSKRFKACYGISPSELRKVRI